MDDPLAAPAGPAPRGLNATGLDDLCFSEADEGPGVWTLCQGDTVVGVVKTAPTSLVVADGTWVGSLSTGRRGWRAQFRREGIGTETLSYHPRLIGAGAFRLGMASYRLRAPFLGSAWKLFNDSGGEIARLEGLHRATIKVKLGPAAVHEPRLAALVLASCLAMVWSWMAPRVGGADGGGA